MAYDTLKGFTVDPIEDLIDSYRVSANENYGTNYTIDEFKGTDEYGLCYTSAQKDAESLNYFAQLDVKVKEYIQQTNQKISRPSVIQDTIVSFFESKYNFECSVEQATATKRGYLNLCFNYTPESELNQSIANDIVKQSMCAGSYMEGDIIQSAILSNGQAIECRWKTPEEISIEFFVTVYVSRNAGQAQLTPDELKEIFDNEWSNQYKMGRDVEPQRYLNLLNTANSDGSIWSAGIVVTSAIGGEQPTNIVRLSTYDQLYIPNLSTENIEFIDISQVGSFTNNDLISPFSGGY